MLSWLRDNGIRIDILKETDLIFGKFDSVDDFIINENDVLFQKVTQAYSEKNPSAPIRSRTLDLPITSSDALPLSYRRLVGAKAIKLGSCDKHPAYC